jgi:pimeloyl-ACP methyl ester carboxylesterase
MYMTVSTRLLAALVLALLISQPSAAAIFKEGSVKVVDQKGEVERRIYTEISRGSATAPVVVLLNGLIYELNRWAPVADTLADSGLTVVRLSYSPQPESLLLMKEGETPSFIARGLELPVLAEDVKKVLDYYRINRSVTIVGLSYGGTVATEFAKQYPKQVKNLVLLSPLVVPLDTYQTSSAPLRAMLDSVRFWETAPCAAYGWINPWLCSSTDFWYDSFYNYFYENYLNMRVASTPAGIDPAVYKKAVFQLVRAARNYDLKTEIVGLKNIHLVVASDDEPNLKADQLRAWTLIPKSERRSFAEITGVKHALPDEAPAATAGWIGAIAKDAADMQHGEEWIVEGKPAGAK